MALSLASLLLQETKDAIYDAGIKIAAAVGLPVTSWQAGDPTRSLFRLQAEILSNAETIISGYISSGFLDYATGDWLKLLAYEQFGVSVPDATAATCDVVLTNTGGGYYPNIAAGDLTFKSSVNGFTYKNTTGGSLNPGPGSTLTVTCVCDVVGSTGSAGVGEIDTMVTTLLGVTVSNLTVAVGVDEQSEDTTRAACRARLGRLSPNGPSDAYYDVAVDSELTGTTAVTRVRTYADSSVGSVTVYLAGASGSISSADRTKVETAILKWATPLCITPTISSASNVTVDIAYTVWIYSSANKTTAQVQADVQKALQNLFSTRPIGGDILTGNTTGSLFKSLIESTIRGVSPYIFRVSLTTPSSDVALSNNEVAALGTITPTINIVKAPG